MATSEALVERTVPPVSPAPPVGAATVPPKPPAMIAGTERFIALAIWSVRIVPDAPTIMPATIITGLDSARPVAAAESPVNALSSEITTGMSAPPIGSTSRLPRIADDDQDAEDEQQLGVGAGGEHHAAADRDQQQARR